MAREKDKTVWELFCEFHNSQIANGAMYTRRQLFDYVAKMCGYGLFPSGVNTTIDYYRNLACGTFPPFLSKDSVKRGTYYIRLAIPDWWSGTQFRKIYECGMSEQEIAQVNKFNGFC